MISVVNQYHEDNIFVSNLTEQNIQVALKCCLEKRRKMILVKCWDTINHLPRNVDESSKCLIAIASISKASLQALAKNYLRMIETGLSCEPQDEFIVKKLVLRLIKSMSYFCALFNLVSLQELVQKLDLKQVEFQDVEQDALRGIVRDWTGKVIKMIEDRIISHLSKIHLIDTISSIAEDINSNWSAESNQDLLQSASDVSMMDVNCFKLKIDDILKMQMSSNVSMQLSTLYSSIQMIGKNSDPLFVWNLVDDDNHLRAKSYKITDIEQFSDFSENSKLFMDNCSSLYRLPTCEVVTAVKEDLQMQLSKKSNSIIHLFRLNQNDLGVISACNGLLSNDSFKKLHSDLWPEIEKLLLNLRCEKCKNILFHIFERLALKLEKDLGSSISSRQVPPNATNEVKPSWLPTNISISLYNFLTGAAKEINSSFEHCPSDLYPFLWNNLREIFASSYDRHFEVLNSGSKSIPIRETYSGQAYFDLLFVKQILISSSNGTIKQEAGLLQPIIKKFESFLDPFDLHLLSGDLHSNLLNCIQSLSLVLIVLLPAISIGFKGNKEKGTNRLEPEVQKSNKACPEFSLIE